jgi:hypothetical protein
MSTNKSWESLNLRGRKLGNSVMDPMKIEKVKAHHYIGKVRNFAIKVDPKENLARMPNEHGWLLKAGVERP